MNSRPLNSISTIKHAIYSETGGKLPFQTGKSRNGEWKKQDIIVENTGQFPKKVCVTIWGDKIEGVKLQPGETYDISFDIESREYNGKW